MTEPNISTKGWTSDQKIDLLLTMLSVNNPKLTGGSWDVIAAKLNKKHPEKTREAARYANYS